MAPGSDPDPAKQVRVAVNWPIATADFDVYIYAGFPATGSPIATSASSADPEVVVLPAQSAVYTVRVVPFAPAGQTYTATVTLENKASAPAVGAGPIPRYQNYPPNPGDLAGADSAGEPSIGVDWNPNVATLKDITPPKKLNTGGVAFYTANLNEYRVNFDDCSSPASNLWEDVTNPTEGVETLDPIGFVDHPAPAEAGTGLGRVFQSQLAGASSIMSYSQDDGNTWTQSQGSGQPAGADHQTVGGGPYNNGSFPPPPPHPLYPHQIYYASQDVATALAARSDDGGLTFGPGIPVWNLTQCGGLHGHIKVGPDGTVYIPNKSCGTDTGVAVSQDNGLTWTVKTIPGSGSGGTDPSIGIGSDNTIYLGYQNAANIPHIAVSTDHGDTWHDVDVSGGIIQNAVFPEVVAGDGDRAAFGFLGTSTGGGYEGTDSFTGVWYFYIATTYDRGQTYTLVNATGHDPVQIGSICTSGTTCGSDRNLLDFNDLQIDAEGRVLAAYADGCVAPSCTEGTAGTHNPPYNESRSALASVVRQSGGPRLLSAFDSQAACSGSPVTCTSTAPGSPRVDSVATAGAAVHLAWSEPDNGGSPLLGYNIYRRTTSGAYGAPLATVTKGCPACKTTYDDSSAVPGTSYFYKVTAINAVGEGGSCREFPVGAAGPLSDPCLVPGITILTDPAGDIIVPVGQTSNPGWDLRSLSIAEPFSVAPDKIVFTLKIDGFAFGLPPSSTRWPIQFLINGGTTTGYWVDMSTYATDGGTPAAPVFKYGTFNPTGGASGAYEAPNTRVGNADPASNFAADGTITIIVPRSAIGNPAIGAHLTGFLIRVRFGSDAAAVTPDNMPDSLAPGGDYTVVGNAICAPNTPPLADLRANPTTGQPPLIVHFDATNSSDPDFQDTISSYTFTFGDGTPDVTQSAPLIDHTYTSAGTFGARLVVTDSRGAASTNPAQQVITVSAPPSPTPAATATATASPSATATATASPTPTATATASPTPTATATASPTPTATGSPSATATATASPTATATATPTATATATPSTTPANVQLVNIAGRTFTQTGDKVGIAGFIISGSGTKRIMARAIGPSLSVNGKLQDPYLEIHDSAGNPPLTNDNWRSTQEAEIQQTGLAPTDDHESAIVKRLPAGNYTAIIRGADNSPGIGVVELYDLSTSDPGELGNLSVRADVQTDDKVLFDGMILQGGAPKRVLFRAIGPSIKINGTPVPGTLQDPTLSFYSGNGTLIATNDNWHDAPNASDIQGTGLAPLDDRESAILVTLMPGNYTTIVRGVNGTTGIALAEAYKLP